jgi:nitrite reductase (NADH) small subunit
MSTDSVRARVGTVGELPAGESRVVEAAGRSVAVFNVDGKYYAIDNACPHRGGPLSEGDLEGRVISCPWHAWRWDVSTGANVNNPAVRVACFPVQVDGDGVFVDVTADA